MTSVVTLHYQDRNPAQLRIDGVRDNLIQDGGVELSGVVGEPSRWKTKQPLKDFSVYRQVQPERLAGQVGQDVESGVVVGNDGRIRVALIRGLVWVAEEEGVTPVHLWQVVFPRLAVTATTPRRSATNLKTSSSVTRR